jgi:hypothetical protein
MLAAAKSHFCGAKMLVAAQNGITGHGCTNARARPPSRIKFEHFHTFS